MSGLEAFGGVAAVTQLIGCITKAYSYLIELERKTHNQSELLGRLSDEVECIIESVTFITSASPGIAQPERIIQRCLEKATTLCTVLGVWKSEELRKSKRSVRSWFTTATLKSKEKEMVSLRQDVKEIMEILTFHVLCTKAGNATINNRVTPLPLSVKRGSLGVSHSS